MFTPTGFFTTPAQVGWGTPPSQDANCWMFWDAANPECYSGTGTTVTDLKGNSDGTLIGANWSFETQSSLGVLRNNSKTNNYVSSAAYVGTNTAATFEMFWYSHFTLVDDGAMIEWKGGPTTYTTIWEANMQQYVSPLRAYMYLSGESGSPRGGDVLNNMTLTQGQWWHMVITAGRNDVNRLYINGTEVDTGNPATETYSGTETWVWDQAGKIFGFHTGNKNWVGDWAVLRAYDAKLSAAEVTANYNYYNGRT